jgi:hypothetical protein
MVARDGRSGPVRVLHCRIAFWNEPQGLGTWAMTLGQGETGGRQGCGGGGGEKLATIHGTGSLSVVARAVSPPASCTRHVAVLAGSAATHGLLAAPAKVSLARDRSHGKPNFVGWRKHPVPEPQHVAAARRR